MIDLFELWKKKAEVEEAKVIDKVYVCTAGKKTTGCGFNIEDNPIPVSILEYWITVHGLPEDVYNLWLNHEFKKLNSAFIKFSWFNHLDQARKVILLDMAHNMGVSGCLNFTNMIAAMKRNDWQAASNELLDSSYGRIGSATRNRALRNSKIMLTGEL